MGTRRNNKYHARFRAMERYNLVLTDAECTHIVHQIKSQHAYLIDKLSNTRRLYRVKTTGGIEMNVIYCKNKKQIVTVLPKE